MFNLYKKLFATPCLLSLLMSCGKEIVNSKQNNQITRRSALSTTSIRFNISYDANNEKKASASYQAKSTGWLTIPKQPLIKKGSALVISSRLFINSPQINPNTKTSFYCDYSSVKINTANSFSYSHFFNGCNEDLDGDGIPEELNYQPGDTLALDDDNFVIVEIKTSSSTDIIEYESDIELDLH